MERENTPSPAKRFDVLAVDAFSSDAIPVHLLTKECAEEYFKILKDDGILAIHVSNRYLKLEHVTLGLAEAYNQQAIRVHTSGSDDDGTYDATWVLVTNNTEFVERIIRDDGVKDLALDQRFHPVLWTDSYTNLLSVMSAD